MAVADAPAFGDLHWRSIGPGQSGGRISAVAGSDADPYLYYIGAADGGVFRTDDGGFTWTDVWARQPVAAIGAIAVAKSDHRVVWVGTGESKPRNDASYGDGVWVSRDSGASWSHRGLEHSYIISRILVSPSDARVAIAGALGDPFLDSRDRGVYRTTDGGATWHQTLVAGPRSGVADLACDARCSLVFAAVWQFRRTPWTFESGGPIDGIYRSTDGGVTWSRLHGNGLPTSEVGRIGLAVAPSDAKRVYAVIESKEGVLWRSDDAGLRWRMVHRDDTINTRPFYMSRIEVDPRDPNHVFALSEDLFESHDGGVTFTQLKNAVHQDHHALWIAANGKRMIEGDDGAAPISLDGGTSWEWRYNIAIGQIYRVAYDMQNPYHICGGFQDNDSFCGTSDSLDPLGILWSNWRDVGNDSDGSFTVPDLTDPNIVWNVGVKDLNGQLNTFMLDSRQSYDVSPSSRDTNGIALAGLPYRFNWEAPIAMSPADPASVYFGGNVVFKTVDRGRTWQVISPDLTRNESQHQQAAGGSITHDVSGAEFYDTLLTIAPSPLDGKVIWTGADDGRVHVTRDGGARWSDVSPPVEPYGRVENVEPSPFDSGTAFIGVDRHFVGDPRAYAFETDDYGATWHSIASDLPSDQYVHVVRQDPRNANILYAGLEQGIWISFDRGAHWRSLQQDLPVTAVRDLRVQPAANDLVVATHGRGFFVLDDLAALQQLAQAQRSVVFLFPPRTTYAWWRWWLTMYGTAAGECCAPQDQFVGENPPSGAILTYYLNPESVATEPGSACRASSGTASAWRLDISDADGHAVRSLELHGHPGMNRIAWNLTEAPPHPWRGARYYQGPDDGAMVVPGTYTARLIFGSIAMLQRNGGNNCARMPQFPATFEATLAVKPDPRGPWTQADYIVRYQFLHALNDELSQVDDMLNELDALKKRGALDAAGKALYDRLTSNPANSEDNERFPDRMREHLTVLLDLPALSQGPPTPAQLAEANALKAQLEALGTDYAAYMKSRI